MCRSRRQAEAALARLRELLAELGLEPKEAKTRILQLKVGGEGVDFLGFHHRLVNAPARPGRRPFPFLARWPADKALRHARERIRELTDRSRLLLPTETVVQDLNSFLNGWAAYFKYGNSAHRFGVIREYVLMRMALFIGKRHKRSRGFGRYVVSYASPDHLGLVSLAGNVVAPRPFRDWRGKPNAGGERRR
jgi:RNA-directed DNA polymerase